MSRQRLIIGFVLAFAAGMVIGAVVGAITQLEYMKRNPFHLGPPSPQSLKHAILNRLSNDLGLSAAQVEKIKPILDSLHQEMETLRENNRPLIQQHIKNTDAKIEALLSPEQVTKFKEFQKRMRKRFRRDFHDHPAPPDFEGKLPPDHEFDKQESLMAPTDSGK